MAQFRASALCDSRDISFLHHPYKTILFHLNTLSFHCASAVLLAVFSASSIRQPLHAQFNNLPSQDPTTPHAQPRQAPKARQQENKLSEDWPKVPNLRIISDATEPYEVFNRWNTALPWPPRPVQ